MQAIAAGDPRAARQVVEQHLPVALSLARHMLGSQAEAQEIAQEAFLRLWKQAPKWEPGRALVSTWLRRIASNLCIDRLRQRRTRPLLAQDERSVAASQQHDMEEMQMKQRVNRALDELPARQKLALTLYHYEGMSQKQAAHVMEISEHALESLMARAKRGLKARLANDWQQLLPDQVVSEGHDGTKLQGQVGK